MRRGILVAIGALETLVAGVLLAVGVDLPAPEAVTRQFDRIGNVSKSAERQVQLMRQQVDEIRQKDLPGVVGQLRSQTRKASATLRNKTIDFQTVAALSDALAAVSAGLEHWSETLHPGKYLAGGREQPELLDRRWAASARQAASSLEQLATDLEADIHRLLRLIDSPEEARNRREFELAFKRCSANLDLLGNLLQEERFREARNGFRELEASLAIAARQVDVLSEAAIPTFTPNGLMAPSMELRPIWPDGKRIAEALHRADAEVKAVERQFDEIGGALPPLLSGEGSHLLRSRAGTLPESSESLSKTARELAALLPVAQRLRSVATGLRKTEEGIELTLRSWPELVEAMGRSATVLQGSRKQLDTILAYRESYERAVASGLQLLETTEDVIQGYTSKFDVRLGEQEYSLGQMEEGLSEVNEALPTAAESAKELMKTARWILWALAALVGLHGMLIAGDALFRRRSQ